MRGLADQYRPLQEALERRYEIRREVGQGAHAIVFLAHDLRHDRPVALKVLRAEGPSEEDEIRFSREIKFLARLQHPNILPLHDSGHVLDMYYYVVPFVEGSSLRERLQREKRLDVDEAVRITRSIAEALEYAHRQGIIHRDIKPENILFSGSHPLLADFGVARAIDQDYLRTLTKPGLGGPGTPAYMSPEQLIADQAVDARTDVYSLGCVLYEMLAGVAPFAGKDGFVKRFTEMPAPLSTVRDDVPGELEQAILRAIAREPSGRFATAAEFAAAIVRQPRVDAPAEARPVLTRRTVAVPTAPLIGREREVAEIASLIARHRVITLVGPGGVGKTRLATQLAADHRNSFADGSAVIPMIAARTTDDLVANIGEELAVTFGGARDPKLQLCDALRDKHLLLVLDGFEHLTKAATFVAELVGRTDRITVLVTSRERLNIADEAALEVQGLGVREPSDGAVADPGTALFLDRAQRTNARFRPTDRDSRAIHRIVKGVGGLPLGIEIAASLVRLLDCEEIAAELERDIGGVATTRRDIPERHRSLGNVFEQSWTLLETEERSALARLSLLSGSFTREAGQAIADADLSVLGSLVDKSLVQRRQDGRFEMHDVVRQFAQLKLREQPQALAAAKESLESYFGQMLASIDADLYGANVYRAVEAIGKDLENIRAGWGYAIDSNNDAHVATYANTLFRFYMIRGRYSEGNLELAEAERRGKSDRLAALILVRRAVLAQYVGEPMARSLARRSIHILRSVAPDSIEMGIALRAMGFIASDGGRHRVAQRLLDRALVMLRGRANDTEIGWCFINLGINYVQAGRYTEGERAFNEAVEIFTRTGEPRDRLTAMINLSALRSEAGRGAEAMRLRIEAMEVARALGDGYLLAAALINLADSHIALREFSKARELLREAEEYFRTFGRPHGVCECEVYLAEIERIEGNYASAEARLRWAVNRAADVDALRTATRAAMELALLREAMGRPTAARALAMFALNHPASSAHTCRLARELRERTASIGVIDESLVDDKTPGGIVATINRLLEL